MTTRTMYIVKIIIKKRKIQMCDFTGETVKTTEKCEENTRTLTHVWNVPVKTEVKLLHDHKRN